MVPLIIREEVNDARRGMDDIRRRAGHSQTTRGGGVSAGGPRSREAAGPPAGSPEACKEGTMR